MNQKGFSAFDIVLGVALVVVIAVAGYFAYQNFQNRPSSSATPSPKASASPTPTPDPYVGWKTYTSKVERASFRYPADWTIRDQSYAGRDMVTITSPSGSNVSYDSNVSGQGGGMCGHDDYPACVNVVINSIEPLPKSTGRYFATATSSQKFLFLIGDGSTITPKVGDTGVHGTEFHPKFKSKDGKRDLAFETARLGDAPENFKPADEPTIKLILLSYEY